MRFGRPGQDSALLTMMPGNVNDHSLCLGCVCQPSQRVAYDDETLHEGGSFLEVFCRKIRRIVPGTVRVAAAIRCRFHAHNDRANRRALPLANLVRFTSQTISRSNCALSVNDAGTTMNSWMLLGRRIRLSFKSFEISFNTLG